jgi:hypothetical protein
MSTGISSQIGQALFRLGCVNRLFGLPGVGNRNVVVEVSVAVTEIAARQIGKENLGYILTVELENDELG